MYIYIYILYVTQLLEVNQTKPNIALEPVEDMSAGISIRGAVGNGIRINEI